MEMGLQTEDWVLGVERCILVWHEVGEDGGSTGKMDDKKRKGAKLTDMFLLCGCLHGITFAPLVCILMSTTVSVWILIDETVILLHCCPCEILSTAPTKTH